MTGSLGWVLGQTRWVLRKTRWVRFVTQIIGWELSRNSVREKKSLSSVLEAVLSETVFDPSPNNPQEPCKDRPAVVAAPAGAPELVKGELTIVVPVLKHSLLSSTLNTTGRRFHSTIAQRALWDISMPRGTIDSPLSRGNFWLSITVS